MKPLALIALIPLALIAGVIAFALVFGGPSDPPPMPSISNPFKNVDFSDMAATRRFAADFGVEREGSPSPGFVVEDIEERWGGRGEGSGKGSEGVGGGCSEIISPDSS